MNLRGGTEQMIARLAESSERGGIAGDDRVRTGEAAEEVAAQLAGAGPWCDAGQRILAIKAKHRYGRALRERRWWGWARRRRAAPCACLRVAHVAEESTLERGDADAMGSLHLRGLDVANRRTDVLMVGERLDRTQVS